MKNNDLVVVVSNANLNNNAFETIEAISESGFKKVFIQWYNRDWIPTQEQQFSYIKDLGLEIPYAHLSYDGIKDLWLPEGDYLVDRYIRDLQICKKKGINIVMMHITSSKKQEYNEMGIERLKKIVKYAEDNNMKIALENVRYKEALEYTFGKIKSNNLGICFDTGHFHCYSKDDFNFELFKDKIFLVHIHDNHGMDDEHLLPFDGTIDWEYIGKCLKDCHYKGSIILEIVYGKKYLGMDIKDFYKKGYEIGNKLTNLIK